MGLQELQGLQELSYIANCFYQEPTYKKNIADVTPEATTPCKDGNGEANTCSHYKITSGNDQFPSMCEYFKCVINTSTETNSNTPPMPKYSFLSPRCSYKHPCEKFCPSEHNIDGNTYACSHICVRYDNIENNDKFCCEYQKGNSVEPTDATLANESETLICNNTNCKYYKAKTHLQSVRDSKEDKYEIIETIGCAFATQYSDGTSSLKAKCGLANYSESTPKLPGGNTIFEEVIKEQFSFTHKYPTGIYGFAGDSLCMFTCSEFEPESKIENDNFESLASGSFDVRCDLGRILKYMWSGQMHMQESVWSATTTPGGSTVRYQRRRNGSSIMELASKPRFEHIHMVPYMTYTYTKEKTCDVSRIDDSALNVQYIIDGNCNDYSLKMLPWNTHNSIKVCSDPHYFVSPSISFDDNFREPSGRFFSHNIIKKNKQKITKLKPSQLVVKRLMDYQEYPLSIAPYLTDNILIGFTPLEINHVAGDLKLIVKRSSYNGSGFLLSNDLNPKDQDAQYPTQMQQVVSTEKNEIRPNDIVQIPFLSTCFSDYMTFTHLKSRRLELSPCDANGEIDAYSHTIGNSSLSQISSAGYSSFSIDNLEVEFIYLKFQNLKRILDKTNTGIDESQDIKINSIHISNFPIKEGDIICILGNATEKYKFESNAFTRYGAGTDDKFTLSFNDTSILHVGTVDPMSYISNVYNETKLLSFTTSTDNISANDYTKDINETNSSISIIHAITVGPIVGRVVKTYPSCEGLPISKSNFEFIPWESFYIKKHNDFNVEWTFVRQGSKVTMNSGFLNLVNKDKKGEYILKENDPKIQQISTCMDVMQIELNTRFDIEEKVPAYAIKDADGILYNQSILERIQGLNELSIFTAADRI